MCYLGSQYRLEFLKSVELLHDRHDVVSVQQVPATRESSELLVDAGQQTLRDRQLNSGRKLVESSQDFPIRPSDTNERGTKWRESDVRPFDGGNRWVFGCEGSQELPVRPDKRRAEETTWHLEVGKVTRVLLCSFGILNLYADWKAEFVEIYVGGGRGNYFRAEFTLV